MKLYKLFIFVFAFVFVLSLTNAAYTISHPKLTTGGAFSAFGNVNDIGFNDSMCKQGQDFIVQIDPLGCSPAVVRSDLLEEQDVPIFCKIQAIKINPILDVEAFRTINIKGEYPREVKTVGFYPSTSALGENVRLNNLMWDEIGYAMVYLRQQPNETAMPEFVEGNLTAKITYDLQNSFGIRYHSFYLPVMDDNEFDRVSGQYAFFDKRGYLRAEDVTEDSASIVVYSGQYESPFGKSRSGEISRQALGSYNLREGGTTGTIYLPGFECYSGVKFKLEDVDSVDTTAKLSVNSEPIEVRKGDKFLEDKCSVVQVQKRGVNEKVRLRCSTDEGSDLFELNLNPSIELRIDGKVKDYQVGELLFKAEAGAKNAGKDIYLAYVGTTDGSTNEEELEVVLIATRNYPNNKLSDDDILAAYYMFKGKTNLEEGGTVFNNIGAGFLEVGKKFVSGEDFEKIPYENLGQFSGKMVEVIGFGGSEDYPLNREEKEAYESSIEEYDFIISNLRQEKYPEDMRKTISEEVSISKINLAYKMKQKNDLSIFCSEFEDLFPESYEEVRNCQDAYRISNEGISSKDILIENDYKSVELENVFQPGFEKYGAKIFIEGLGNSQAQSTVEMEKDQMVRLNGDDYIRLIDLDEEHATLEVHIGNFSTSEKITNAFFSENKVFKLDRKESFGGYTFVISEINLERVAKVKVIPETRRAGTEAEFEFKVGIEKRAIQLSPEKTEERIEKLDNTISKLENISSGLDTVVESMKTACFATGAVLTAKNLVSGFNGKTIAREKVMRGEGGWYEKCADKEYGGVTHDSVDECLLKNSDSIDNQVNEIVEVMNQQNANIKKVQEANLKETSSSFGEKIVDKEGLAVDYAKNTKEKMNSSLQDVELKKGTIEIKLQKILEVLDEDGYKNGMYRLEDLKSLELYTELYSSTDDSEQKQIYKDRLITSMKQIEVNSENYFEYQEANRELDNLGLENSEVQIKGNEKATQEVYQGDVPKSDIGEIEAGTPTQAIAYENKKYLVSLERSGSSNEYSILDVYYFNGTAVSESLDNYIRKGYSKFVKYDSSSYLNPYSSEPKVRYYETEPYKGLPAVVPFDEQNGWYAYVRQTTSSLGSIRGYDDSGRINSFWLCNVGDNGLEDFSERRDQDDICQQINLNTGQPYNEFPGLTASQASKKVNQAVKAIEKASRVYKPGIRRIEVLDGIYMDVGSPAVSSSGMECQDVMSPKDCQIMFNVCDPVICPRSRCDFGGAYPVRDVIQSGVIGSVALCLPNAKEGIVAPVCLTGVKAGIDGFTSTLQAYEDCLSDSLDTGQTTGVCDEINSIYMCSFFWEQAMPLAKATLPNLIGRVTGQTRGGGEYLGIQTAFENAKESINFFTQDYALNSFNAFKARSQENIGSEVCKNFVSISYPEGQGFLDVLTEADSPAQYNGNFEAIPYTTVTNPPIDQYKVYFHIFAGNDRGAYYQVYLRGGGSSYYADTFSGRNVASGYIPVGDYESQTVDFTAPSGYDELCIQVNEDERCGFKEVSTGFARNYMMDQYLQKQINDTDISSESECVSGTASAYNLLNLNAQKSAGEILDPAIYNRGIIRICSTENPGKGGSDPYYPGENQRWIEVGNCGSNSVKCWIDKQSIDGALEFETSVNESLESLTENLIGQFEEAEGMLRPEEFEDSLESIDNETDLMKKIFLAEKIMDKVFRNNQKAALFQIKGDSWAQIAIRAFNQRMISAGKEVISGDNEVTTSSNFSTLRKKNIYDLVKEEDFSSSVLQIDKRDYLLQAPLCFYYSGGNWTWKKGSCGTLDGWRSPLQYDEARREDKAYIRSLENKGYLEGLRTLLGVIGSSKNYKSLTARVGENNKYYEHKSLGYTFAYYHNNAFFESNSNRVYFKYFGGEWNFIYYLGGESYRYPVSDFDKMHEEFKPRYQGVVSLLRNTGYEGGAAIILSDLDSSLFEDYVGYVNSEGLCEDKCLSSYTLGINGKYNANSKECEYDSKNCEDYCDFEKNVCSEEIEDMQDSSGFAAESICGEDILKWAEDKIGQDTFRIESGKKVYTNPCATFVSNVLIEVGVYPSYTECSVDTIPYRDAVFELNEEFSKYDDYIEIPRSEWRNGLEQGDVVMFKNYGRTTVYMDFQHVTIFSKYNSDGGFEVVHDGGSSSKISRRNYSPDVYTYVGVPHISTVWRYSGDKCSVGEVSSSSSSSQDSEEVWTLESAYETALKFPESVTYESNGRFASLIEELFEENILNNAEYFLFRTDLHSMQANRGALELQDLLNQLKNNIAHWDGRDKIVLAEFSESERKIITDISSSCSDCGQGGFLFIGNNCDEAECLVIGAFSKKKCVFENNECFEE